MPRFTSTALACLALAGGGVIAGCGDDETTSSTPAAAPAPAETAPAETEAAPAASGDTVAVSMKDIKFIPETVQATVGQKIVWTNDEAVPHNVTAEEGADFKSETLNQNDTYEYTTEKAGTIAYVCTIHPGQNGTIDVK